MPSITLVATMLNHSVYEILDQSVIILQVHAHQKFAGGTSLFHIAFLALSDPRLKAAATVSLQQRSSPAVND